MVVWPSLQSFKPPPATEHVQCMFSDMVALSTWPGILPSLLLVARLQLQENTMLLIFITI